MDLWPSFLNNEVSADPKSGSFLEGSRNEGPLFGCPYDHNPARWGLFWADTHVDMIYVWLTAQGFLKVCLGGPSLLLPALLGPLERLMNEACAAPECLSLKMWLLAFDIRSGFLGSGASLGSHNNGG